MEAIVEAIGALLHLGVLIADIFIRSVLFFIDSCRFGYEEAVIRNQQRRDDGVSPVLTRLGGLGLFGVTILATVGLLSWWHSYHQQKITATEKLVDRLAEGFYQQTTTGDPVFQNGPLPEQDAWGRPVRLDAEKSLMGWWILVSSDGPDGRPATSDDVEALRSNWANLEQVGGELAARGTNKVKEKLKAMFAGKAEAEPPGIEEPPAEEAVPGDELTGDEAVVAQESGDLEDQPKKGWKLPPLKFSWGKKEE